jgi:hypothetical protein
MTKFKLRPGLYIRIRGRIYWIAWYKRRLIKGKI